MSKAPPSRMVMEATGGYESIIVAELFAAELPVVVINPRQVRDFVCVLSVFNRCHAQPLGFSTDR